MSGPAETSLLAERVIAGAAPTDMSPLTSNVVAGESVPIPTLPPSKTKLSVVALLFTLRGVVALVAS